MRELPKCCGKKQVEVYKCEQELARPSRQEKKGQCGIIRADHDGKLYVDLCTTCAKRYGYLF